MCRPRLRSSVLPCAALLLSLLGGCQTTAQRDCEAEGHAPDSAAFRDCVAERRLEGGMEMKRQAGGNAGRLR